MTTGLAPLFPFYGSKWRDARRYQGPRHGRAIEPFAGATWLPFEPVASIKSTRGRSEEVAWMQQGEA
jgi:hypothetical protein